jgi:hypothetical protein
MAKTDSDLNQILDIIEAVSITDERDRARQIGKKLGIIFTKLYNVQVPEVEYKTLE